MSKKLAIIFGIVFVIVGVLGFVPNPIVGHDETMVIFLTDSLHDIVHILIGVILIVAGTKSSRAASKSLMVFGIVYLVLAVVGFMGHPLLGLVTANRADDWLHVVLGVVLLAVSMIGKKNEPMMASSISSI